MSVKEALRRMSTGRGDVTSSLAKTDSNRTSGICQSRLSVLPPMVKLQSSSGIRSSSKKV